MEIITFGKVYRKHLWKHFCDRLFHQIEVIWDQKGPWFEIKRGRFGSILYHGGFNSIYPRNIQYLKHTGRWILPKVIVWIHHFPAEETVHVSWSQFKNRRDLYQDSYLCYLFISTSQIYQFQYIVRLWIWIWFLLRIVCSFGLPLLRLFKTYICLKKGLSAHVPNHEPSCIFFSV